MNIKFWNKKIAMKLAFKEGIKLSYIHWKIIYYFRFFYFEYGNIPNIRSLLNYLNKYNNKYDSILLYNLFPKGLIKQVSKIACLPLSVQCF